MAYQPFRLSSKEQSKLKQAMDELNAIKEDIERAKAAGVPGMDELIAVCDGKQECIAKLRAAYSAETK